MKPAVTLIKVLTTFVATFHLHSAEPPARHLLLDERVIERADNAKLTLGPVKKHPNNPLFGEDKPWEKQFDNLYANVLYDESDGLYKCWYSPFIVDHSAKGLSPEQRNSTRYRPPPGREMGVCYAVSLDGLRWEKPELNLVDFEGSRANNLVLRGPHGAGILKEMEDPEPRRRYKMFTAEDMRFSADGLHWSDPAPSVGISSRSDTHNNMLRVKEPDRYVGFVRLWSDGWGRGQRVVGRTESADLSRWTKAVEILRGDPQNQAYSMPVFRYENLYLGLVAIFRTEENRVHTELARSPDTGSPPAPAMIGRVHTELAWSPDTVTWHRIQPGTPFIGNSPKEGDYDWGCVYAAHAPVVLNDEILIYYGGSNGRHGGWREGFFCVATLRRDGWAGYEPIDAGRPATVVTKPVAAPSTTLRLSADVAPGGSIRVAVEHDGARTLAACEPITSTVTAAPVTWQTDKPLGTKPVALRFELTRAKLYSFWFEESGSPK